MFLNVARVSYIDPAFDRCALAHEWLSVSDTYRSNSSSSNTGAMISVQDHQIPTAAAALHLLCRVEQRPDLVYTVRDFYENQFKQENIQSMVQRFAEGIPPASRCGRSISLLLSEIIPYTLQILSSGQGTGSLDRVTASSELLNPNEVRAFDRHSVVLYSLGLSYVSSEGSSDRDYRSAQKMLSATLDPPIHKLVEYTGFNVPPSYERHDIPSGVSWYARADAVPIATCR